MLNRWGAPVRCLVSFFLSVVALTWIFPTWAEPDALQSLSGEWHQIASNAGRCANCRIIVRMAGENFSVKASNGWAAVVRPSFQGKPYAAGKGSWEPNSGGSYGGKEFYLNLGIVNNRLLMLMTVLGPDGKLSNINATFQKESGESL